MSACSVDALEIEHAPRPWLVAAAPAVHTLEVAAAVSGMGLLAQLGCCAP